MLAIQLPGCAFTPWDKSINKTKFSELQVEDAQNKVAKNPEDVIARKNLLLTTELATTRLYVDAEKARLNGQYEEAIATFDKVLKFLPSDPSAFNGKLKVEREMTQSKKLAMAEDFIEYNSFNDAKEIVRQVLLENPENINAIRIKKHLDEQSPSSNSTLPQLKVQFDKPISLEMRDANIKVVFEALSGATGINFILDKDIKPDTKASILIKKARIEDAIEMVISSNALQKKILSENTVLVYPNTQPKIKEYQDLTLRSFYFTNTSAKQVSALLKTMLKTKDIFVDDRLNMLMMRDTPEAIHLAEKLVAANDLADPEVMLEIEVLEVSRGRLQELGILYPSQLSVLGADTGLTLDALNKITSKTIGVSPSPAVNFKKTTGDINLLSNPRIRVKNNEKAKILVGDKVPIITTTSTADVGISESVTYVDVGLKLDVEPHITLDNFVNIKVGLEVSSLGERTVTRNGASVFTIGTRTANTALRLKNGETQVLAGLILDDERKNASKLPALGDIPLVGRLFSNQQDQKTKTEIVLAITPHIITNIVRPSAEIFEYWSGTENVISDKPIKVAPSSDQEPRLTIEERRERIRNKREEEKVESELQQLEESVVELPQEKVVTVPEPQSANPDGSLIAPN